MVMSGTEEPAETPRGDHVQMEVVSMWGNAQEIMDREARGEPPPPDILDRILAWLPWGS